MTQARQQVCTLKVRRADPVALDRTVQGYLLPATEHVSAGFRV